MTIDRHVFTDLEVQATFHASDVSFSQVQSELNAGRPVAVGLECSGGGGHEVIIRGWDIDPSGQRLRINDPGKGSGFQYYSDLVTAYGQGKWKWTWSGIVKKTEKARLGTH